MKKLIFTLACIASLKAANAQDLLVTTDSSRLQTVVLEIQTGTIKYNLVKNNGGPAYVIARSSVAYINYKNGTTERFTDRKPEPDLAKYNLDGSKPLEIHEYYRIPKYNADNEKLYKRKNYIGLNHLALLNSNISLTYMRDIKSEKIILQIPVSIGFDKPDMTNSTYNGSYLYNGSKNTYNKMDYQVGMALLFTPSFGQKVNFLIGPSLSFSQYDMSTKTTYMVASTTQTNTFITSEFQNDFTLLRQFYGGTLGFLFRMSEKINMSLTANIGCKKDSYSEKDPFGIEYVNKQTGRGRDANTNVLPYTNVSWTIGYRF